MAWLILDSFYREKHGSSIESCRAPQNYVESGRVYYCIVFRPSQSPRSHAHTGGQAITDLGRRKCVHLLHIMQHYKLDHVKTSKR